MSAAKSILREYLDTESDLPSKGSQLVEFICNKIELSEFRLAALLDSTDKSLRAWKKESTSTLIQNKKSKRLVRLYLFVARAAEKNLSSALTLQLLHSPISNQDNLRRTSLDFVNHSDSQLFDQLAIVIVERFIIDLRSIKHEKIALNENDFNAFAKAVENPEKPNDALRKAVKNFGK